VAGQPECRLIPGLVVCVSSKRFGDLGTTRTRGRAGRCAGDLDERFDGLGAGLGARAQRRHKIAVLDDERGTDVAGSAEGAKCLIQHRRQASDTSRCRRVMQPHLKHVACSSHEGMMILSRRSRNNLAISGVVTGGLQRRGPPRASTSHDACRISLPEIHDLIVREFVEIAVDAAPVHRKHAR
jgi:hypothetical protein